MAAADIAPPAAAASDTGAVPQEPVEEATWAPAPPGSQRYDLTPQLSRFLDRHLILPLLDYLADCEVRSPRTTCTKPGADRAWPAPSDEALSTA